MDEINIRGLEVFGNHGVLKEENILGQKFVVNATLYTNTRQAGKEDNLNLTINYAQVCDTIVAFLRDNTFSLIEAAAEALAEKLLMDFELINKISLEILKPWAPVRQHLKTVSVKITRGWRGAYLSLGSNIGDKEAYLNSAITALKKDERCRVVKVSPFYVTEPVGEVEQDDFLNCAVAIDTLCSPYELLELVNRIEAENGRERVIHWGPRTLDIDIILYEGCVMAEGRLTIPHREMANREFVLKPLSDIAPYEIHPVINKSVLEMLNNLTSKE